MSRSVLQMGALLQDGSETRSCNANLKPAIMSVQAGLMRLEEYLGSITGWPMWMRELLSKTHLEHNDRLTIAGVLLGNLVPPIVAAEHVHAKLADGCARVSMRDTFVKVGTGNLKYTYWDVDDKQMQPLIYLGAASTEQGLLSDAHWGPALRLLQSAPPLFNEHLSWYVPSPFHLRAKHPLTHTPKIK